MYKKTILGSLILIFGLLGAIVTNAQEESITITTYYPSPYGSYNELQTNKMAVGDTNRDTQLTSADQPPAKGQLYTARSVIYKPLSVSSLSCSSATEGELVYNDSDNLLYYCDGAAWKKMGGGEISSVYNLCTGSSQADNPSECTATATCPPGYVVAKCYYLKGEYQDGDSVDFTWGVTVDNYLFRASLTEFSPSDSTSCQYTFVKPCTTPPYGGGIIYCAIIGSVYAVCKR